MKESLPNEVYIVESSSGYLLEIDPFIVGLRYTHEGALKLAEEFNESNVEGFMYFPMSVDYYEDNYEKAIADDECGEITWIEFGGYTPVEWERMYMKMKIAYKEFTEATITKMEIK